MRDAESVSKRQVLRAKKVFSCGTFFVTVWTKNVPGVKGQSPLQKFTPGPIFPREGSLVFRQLCILVNDMVKCNISGMFKNSGETTLAPSLCPSRREGEEQKKNEEHRTKATIRSKIIKSPYPQLSEAV